SFLAAGLLSAVLGLIVGIPALRLKGDYLAIITLGFGMIIVNLINNIPFCGQQGLSQGAASSALYANGLGFSNSEKQTYMWLGVFVVIICMTIMIMFVRSKYGRIIRAIRDNEIAASASGINVSFYKVMTFVFSAFFAGISGALYSCSNAALATTSFAFTNGSILNSVFIVVMVVIGGMGSMTGSVIAAIGMFLLNYTIKNGAWVSALPGFLQNIFTYPMLVYSIALVIVIVFRPRGIMGTKEFALCDIVKLPAAIKTKFSTKTYDTAKEKGDK
ncbi:MAG: branched-chain amino acid ABC transporter permease, partial [Coprococcus sp.]